MTDYAHVLAANPAVPTVTTDTLGFGFDLVDATGLLTPEIVPLDLENGIYMVAKNGATVAQYAAACALYARLRGVGNTERYPTVSNDFGVSPTPANLPAGTWTPA